MYMMLRHIRNKAILNTFFKYYSNKKKTYYEILNLEYDCTNKDIKDAFKEMSKKYHPDLNKDAEAQEHFMHVVKAYNVLRNPSSRRSYNNEILIPHNFKAKTERKVDPRFMKIYDDEKRSRYERALVFLSSTALLIYCLYDVVRLLCPVCEVPLDKRTQLEKRSTPEHSNEAQINLRLEDIEAAAAQAVILELVPELESGKKQYRCVCGKLLSEDKYNEILKWKATNTISLRIEQGDMKR